MHRVRHLVLFVALAGCKGDNGDDPDADTDTGDGGPASFEFRSSVTAVEYAALVAPEAIAAHRASSMMLASTAIVVADEKVQDRLNTDGAGSSETERGGDAWRPGALDCWVRPQFPMFSFTIDYTPCEDTYFMSGGVFVNDHPSGPLLFEYNNFQIQGPGTLREIGGVLALDTRGAFPEPLYWEIYNTDSDNPAPDNLVPLGIEIDRVLYGVSYTGGASVDFLNQQWSMWGVATIGPEENPYTVVHGGRVPEDVSPDDPSGADVLKTPLNWLECRCPTSGVSALDMPLEIATVTVDIDDLEAEPDDIDDPTMAIPVNFELSGQAVLTAKGCGEYDVEYQTQDVAIPVTRDQLVGALSFQCATFAVEGELRCQAMVAAANQLEGDLTIEVRPEDATATALDAVEQDFDTSWCKIY